MSISSYSVGFVHYNPLMPGSPIVKSLKLRGLVTESVFLGEIAADRLHFPLKSCIRSRPPKKSFYHIYVYIPAVLTMYCRLLPFDIKLSPFCEINSLVCI